MTSGGRGRGRGRGREVLLRTSSFMTEKSRTNIGARLLSH